MKLCVKLTCLLIILAFTLSIVTVSNTIPNVKASSTVTQVYDCSASDGHIYNYDGTLTNNRVSELGTVVNSSNEPFVGYVPASNSIYRGFVFFNIADIPSYNAQVTSVTLSLYVTNTVGSNNVTIQSGIPAYPNDPLIPTDFNYLNYLVTVGSNAQSTISGTGYWNITLNNDGLSEIQEVVNVGGGSAKFCLRMQNEIDGTFSGGQETIRFNSVESGNGAKLYVTYTLGDYMYSITGPYTENGEVLNGFVNATLSFESDSPLNFLLSGTTGTAQTVNITSTSPASTLLWNITSSYDRQSMFMFTSNDTDVLVYVPHPDDVTYQSTISVTDFATLTNAYAQLLRNIGGYNRVLSQQALELTSSMPFWLVYYAQYEFRIVSDQGTFTWSLVADGITTKEYIITHGMIDTSIDWGNYTVLATRPTPTSINVSYIDGAGSTSQVTTVIKHLEAGEYITDYSQTDAASTQSFVWNEADSRVSYIVTVTATVGDETKVWQYGLSYTVDSGFWSGFFTLLGDFPFPVTQLFGLVIAGLFFCIGNWRDVEAFTAMGVIITAILTIIGWLTVPVLGLGASFMLVVFMYLSKGKKENPYT